MPASTRRRMRREHLQPRIRVLPTELRLHIFDSMLSDNEVSHAISGFQAIDRAYKALKGVCHVFYKEADFVRKTWDRRRADLTADGPRFGGDEGSVDAMVRVWYEELWAKQKVLEKAMRIKQERHRHAALARWKEWAKLKKKKARMRKAYLREQEKAQGACDAEAEINALWYGEEDEEEDESMPISVYGNRFWEDKGGSYEDEKGIVDGGYSFVERAVSRGN